MILLYNDGKNTLTTEKRPGYVVVIVRCNKSGKEHEVWVQNEELPGLIQILRKLKRWIKKIKGNKLL